MACVLWLEDVGKKAADLFAFCYRRSDGWKLEARGKVRTTASGTGSRRVKDRASQGWRQHHHKSGERRVETPIRYIALLGPNVKLRHPDGEKSKKYFAAYQLASPSTNIGIFTAQFRSKRFSLASTCVPNPTTSRNPLIGLISNLSHSFLIFRRINI